MMTVMLPDGYNGHAEIFDATPVVVDKDMVQLAMYNKPWRKRWVRKTELEQAPKEQSEEQI